MNSSSISTPSTNPGSASSTMNGSRIITSSESVVTHHGAAVQPASNAQNADGTSSSASSLRKSGERIISAANTDLLFSLFNAVEEEEAQRRIHVVRRGR